MTIPTAKDLAQFQVKLKRTRQRLNELQLQTSGLIQEINLELGEFRLFSNGCECPPEPSQPLLHSATKHVIAKE